MGVPVISKPIPMEDDRPTDGVSTHKILRLRPARNINGLSSSFVVLQTSGYKVMIVDISVGLEFVRAARPGVSCLHSLPVMETAEEFSGRLGWEPLAVDG